VTLRLDHVMIVVPDLDAAVDQYARLGFRVVPGGRHVGAGTHNALIRFGLDYLELLAIADPVEASQFEAQRRIERFASQGGGAFLYVLATDDLARDLAAARKRGLPVEPPRRMSRRRPDGTLLQWQLGDIAPLGEAPNCPSLIQWEEPDERLAQRYAREGEVGGHPNGARRWMEIVVGVPDVKEALERYRQAYGLEPDGDVFHVRGSTIRLQPGQGIERLVIEATQDARFPADQACGVEIELRRPR